MERTTFSGADGLESLIKGPWLGPSLAHHRQSPSTMTGAARQQGLWIDVMADLDLTLQGEQMRNAETISCSHILVFSDSLNSGPHVLSRWLPGSSRAGPNKIMTNHGSPSALTRDLLKFMSLRGYFIQYYLRVQLNLHLPLYDERLSCLLRDMCKLLKKGA
jgi:hypothetical protein